MVLHGLKRVAENLNVPESTLRRWLKRPEAKCFLVGSMDNAGGGFGRGWYGEISSFDNLKRIVEASTSEARRKAAQSRWGRVDVRSGTNIK